MVAYVFLYYRAARGWLRHRLTRWPCSGAQHVAQELEKPWAGCWNSVVCSSDCPRNPDARAATRRLAASCSRTGRRGGWTLSSLRRRPFSCGMPARGSGRWSGWYYNLPHQRSWQHASPPALRYWSPTVGARVAPSCVMRRRLRSRVRCPTLCFSSHASHRRVQRGRRALAWHFSLWQPQTIHTCYYFIYLTRNFNGLHLTLCLSFKQLIKLSEFNIVLTKFIFSNTAF